MWELSLGASIIENGIARFRAWAPRAKKVAVKLLPRNTGREILLRPGERSYFEGEEENVYAGEHYWYLLDNELYELHVGTFTRQGTFDATIDYLDDLKHLGITSTEL